jgi:hypothetical protein
VYLLCDISLGRPRPVVPACQRRQVFAAIHEGDSPLGISPFHLERHGSRCSHLDKGLPALPEGEVTVQPAVAVEPILVPARRFSHILVDLKGPPQPQLDTPTSSQLWTDPQGGWKPFCFKIWRPPYVRMP